MTKGQRIASFLLMMLVLAVIVLFIDAKVLSYDRAVIVYSSIVLSCLTVFFLEHYFTKPTDVVVTSISVMLLLVPMQSNLKESLGVWYYIIFFYVLFLFLSSMVSLLLLDSKCSSDMKKIRIANLLKILSVSCGKGKLLYFVLIISVIIDSVDSNSYEFISIAIFSSFLLVVDVKKIVISVGKSSSSKNDVGEIIGVQSKNIFLAKLFKERCSLKKYDFVNFRYAMEDSDEIYTGMIIDRYLLDEEQWIKILLTDRIKRSSEKHLNYERLKPNVIYKDINSKDKMDNFVGLIIDKSEISKIRFEYAGKASIVDGTLVEVSCGNINVLYQVVRGITDIKLLESKNETGLVVGEAVQLGVWKQDSLKFEKYGWVPDVNSHVRLASRALTVEKEGSEVQIGTIPNTNYPVLLNIETAISHHLAVLGITGSGKSVLVRHLISKVVDNDFKVICVDFTNEYRDKLTQHSPQSVISEENKEEIFRLIDEYDKEISKYKNQQSSEKLNKTSQQLSLMFDREIEKTIKENNSCVSLFELPDVSNTTSIFEYTLWFFKQLFKIAKSDKCFGKKICVVLEEAHTVIPEWNFIGSRDNSSGALVNCIGQIALQGRKYGVGFIVVGQRTANISKTVLTQCNSIIAFNQFDNTSAEFLGNHMGKDMVNVLPNLNSRQAIAVGKSFRSGVPTIFQVPELDD